jgi:tRNA pseudouridine32 synthase/23S rRNA pseudouridine746 synthase
MNGTRLYLPRLESPPATLLAYLTSRFPHVPAEAWRDRAARGLLTTDEGARLEPDSPYRYGITLCYRREVPAEPTAGEVPEILYRDSEILVADKSHGTLVRPAGDHVERSLLRLLQRRTGFTELAPAHQLDRETAGLVLFTIRSASRGAYQRLFAEGSIEREYLAVGHIGHEPPDRRRWRVQNRLEPGEPWYRIRIAQGRTNAATDIELLERDGCRGLFRLRPETGKKHQLRVHMAGMGFPIVGDSLYPEIRAVPDGGPRLQLLAVELSFSDPLSGIRRSFRSEKALDWRGSSIGHGRSR